MRKEFFSEYSFCYFSFKDHKRCIFCILQKKKKRNESKCNISFINKTWTRSIELFSSFFQMLFLTGNEFLKLSERFYSFDHFRIHLNTQIFFESCKIHFWNYSNQRVNIKKIHNRGGLLLFFFSLQYFTTLSSFRVLRLSTTEL